MNQDILNRILIDRCYYNQLDKIKEIVDQGADIYHDDNRPLRWSIIWDG